MQQLQSLREQKESATNLKLALLHELEERQQQMEMLSMQLGTAKFIEEQIKQFETKKAVVSKDLGQKKEEIRVHQKHCQEQEAILKERVVYIKAFNAKFKDEYDACQKKFQTIQIRDTVVKGIKRLFLLQLCTVFFDRDNQKIFMGLHKLKVMNGSQPLGNVDEEQLACALGYLGLLLMQIARIKGITLKYQFTFKGSRSYLSIQNEQQPLYVGKPSNVAKFSLSYSLFMQNMYMVMDELSISKQWRNQAVNVIVGKIGEMLWVDA